MSPEASRVSETKAELMRDVFQGCVCVIFQAFVVFFFGEISCLLIVKAWLSSS